MLHVPAGKMLIPEPVGIVFVFKGNNPTIVGVLCKVQFILLGVCAGNNGPIEILVLLKAL